MKKEDNMIWVQVLYKQTNGATFFDDVCVGLTDEEILTTLQRRYGDIETYEITKHYRSVFPPIVNKYGK